MTTKTQASNEPTVLGKEKDTDWSQVKPEEGLSHLPVFSSNLGHIPGTIKHWDGEVNKRKQEILNWNNRSTVQKTLGQLTKVAPESVSGEDIAQYCSFAPVLKMVQTLKKDPLDYKTRLQLVSVIIEKTKGLPVEAYRALLLQATVAHTFKMFSMQGIQVALAAQETYLQQLQAKCRHDSRILKLHNKDKEDKELEQLQNLIHRNLSILEKYLEHTTKDGETAQYQFKEVFRIEDIKEILLGQGKKKKDLLSYGPAVVHHLRHHTLLLSCVHDISDIMLKIEQHNPIGYFLKGRIHMSEMKLRLSRYQAGLRSEVNKKNIQQLFKQTYYYYGQAVRLSGGLYKKGSNELTILLEYVNTLRYFIHIIAEIIQLKMPQSWVIDNLKRAMMLLRQSRSDDPKVADLLAMLDNDLESWQ